MVFTAIAVVFISVVEILRPVVDRACRDHRHMTGAAAFTGGKKAFNPGL
jgi:hypothetical protein